MEVLHERRAGIGVSKADMKVTIRVPAPAAPPDDCVLAKIGARDRIQAVIFAYDHGLARPNAD